MIKIELDNKNLEMLLGGDTEIHIEVRRAIAQEFARNFISNLVTKELIEAAREEARKQYHSAHMGTFIKDTAKEVFVEKFGGHLTSDAARTRIRDMIREELDKHLRSEFAGLIEETRRLVMKEAEKIEPRVMSWARSQFDKQMKASLSEKLEALFKEALSTITLKQTQEGGT